MTDPKLGSLVTDAQQRDAVHVAIAPVVAAVVGPVDGGVAPSKNPTDEDLEEMAIEFDDLTKDQRLRILAIINESSVDGGLRVALSIDRRGKLIRLEFGMLLSEVKMTTEEARSFAKGLLDHANRLEATC